jgi:hypothetical protein
LWQVFQELSLWVEALCIHEWCLFTETVKQADATLVQRGIVYTLLTARPDNRRPLTWERNQVDLLLLEQVQFICPWTGKTIRTPTDYALDHIIPIALRPINELWNLVPADPDFNSHHKRDRLPSPTRLAAAVPIFQQTYQQYLSSAELGRVLHTDATTRFGGFTGPHFSAELAQQTQQLVGLMAVLRNVATF